MGTQEDGLNALRRDEATDSWRVARSLSVKNGLASNVILSLAAAPNGDLWVGTPDGLSRIRGNQVETFTSADGLPDDFIRSLLVDADGSLWIGTRRGLTHWAMSKSGPGKSGSGSGGAMKTYTHANGLGSDLVGAMARDTNGDLWVATLAGLSRLHGEHDLKLHDCKWSLKQCGDGAAGSRRRDAADWHAGPWMGCVGWKQIFRGRRKMAWSRRRFTRFWTMAADIFGLRRATALRACDCDEMSGTDGRRAVRTGWSLAPRMGCAAGRRRPTAILRRGARATGICGLPRRRDWWKLDPAHFPVNTIPPPVALERLQVDDVTQPLRAEQTRELRVAAGHVHFEFDYAGLSFIAPQKVRYRYMLEGFDHGWTDAGTRRAAYYTNIPPGKYTFRVQAANNDGVWNTTGAALSFELRPHFYQTIWFYILLLAAIAAVVVLLLRLRLRRAEREFKAVLGERSRIAREIHDTLAQGYVGVSVQLEVLAELLRQRQDGGCGQTTGPDARLCAPWAGGRAAVDLGAAHAGCGRDYAAGEAAAHGGSGRRRRTDGAVQPVWGLSSAACGDGARNYARGAGSDP